MQTVLLISLGAALGANLRYFVAEQTARLATAFPYGTIIINVSGSFVLGVFLIWTAERVPVDPRWRLLVATGFCGGYTTFSSYAFETFALFERGEWTPALLNIVLSNALCFIGVVLGVLLARSL